MLVLKLAIFVVQNLIEGILKMGEFVRTLNTPIDVFVVRWAGLQGAEELVMLGPSHQWGLNHAASQSHTWVQPSHGTVGQLNPLVYGNI